MDPAIRRDGSQKTVINTMLTREELYERIGGKAGVISTSRLEILLHRFPGHRLQMPRNRRVQAGGVLQVHR